MRVLTPAFAKALPVRRLALAAASVFLAALGCGEIVQRPLDELNRQPSMDEDDDDAPSPDDGDLRIELQPDQLAMSPGESAEVHIRVTPADRHELRVALLGDAEGAYVDRPVVRTDTEGRASVRVTVPGDSSGLRLQVSAQGSAAETDIRVSHQDVGVLIVRPEYSGMREIDVWGATLVENRSCIQLTLTELEYSQTFEGVDVLEVEGVPADTQLTLVVRGNEYAFGCREGVNLEGDQEQTVTIAVTDRPLQVAALRFDVGFGLDLTTEIAASIAQVSELMSQAFTEGQSTDLNAVLAEMSSAYGDETEFQRVREERQWDDLLIAALTEAGATSGLSSRVRLWLSQAQSDLFANEFLTASLGGAPGAAGHGLLSIRMLSGQAPHSVGTPSSFLVDLAAEPEDRLRMGFELLWQPTRVLAQLAEIRAQQAATMAGTQFETDEPSAARVLASSIDCRRVGTTLQANGSSGLDDCEAECIAALCESALEVMWERVEFAESEPSRVEITATGPAEIDDTALPVGFAGAWVGDATLLDGEVIPVRGPFATPDPTQATDPPSSSSSAP